MQHVNIETYTYFVKETFSDDGECGAESNNVDYGPIFVQAVRTCLVFADSNGVGVMFVPRCPLLDQS